MRGVSASVTFVVTYSVFKEEEKTSILVYIFFKDDK
jgi:hypothetical protein